MYEEEDEEIADDAITYSFAEAEDVDFGIGTTLQKEEVAEHNRDFEVTILKEHTNNVKQKVESVVNQVQGVEDKVSKVDERLAILTAQLEDMRDSKVKELEFVQDDDYMFELTDMANKEMELNKNKELEDIATKAAQKVLEDAKKKTEIEHKDKSTVTVKKMKGNHGLVAKFKKGFSSVIEGLSNLLGKLVAVIICGVVGYTVYCLSYPSETPDSIAPIIDWLRPFWDMALQFLGDSFTKITHK